MAEIIPSRVVSCAIFDPRKTIFKQVANSRSQCTTLSCTLQSCPLLDATTCVQVHVFGQACPYGSRRGEEGFTKRAGSLSGWISDRRKQYEGVPHCASPAHKMAFVGDYVYLPYSHVDMMNKLVPTLKYGCFLPRPDWTLDTACKLIDFRPQAWTGGEIVSYRQEVVPKFLLHLRETDAAMWEALIAERPVLDTEPNHVGRKAILKTLNSPIEWSTDKTYPVRWRWDGERIRTSSKNAYNSTWGGLKLDEVVVEGVPSEDATVVIQKNTWVNDTTVFVD